MASKRRAAPPPPPPDDEDVVGEVDRDEADEELALAFDDLPANVRVKAYRVQENGEHAWCWTGPPAEMTEERLAAFGPGKYRIMARQRLPNGRDRLKRTRDVHIAASSVPAVAAAPASSSSLIDQIAQTALLTLLDQMQKGAREHSAAMTVLLEKIATPRHDPLLQTLLEKSLGARTADPIDQALRLNELTNKSRSSSGVTELIGTLDALDRIKARVRGKRDDEADESGGGGWAGVFKELIPHILPAPPNDGAPAAAPAPAAAAAVRAPAPALTLERSPVPKLPLHLAPLAPFLPQLVAAAERNVPPEQTGDFLLALLPDAVLEVAESVLAADTLVTEITTAEPRLAAYGAYVDAVRRAMLEQLSSWEREEDPPEGGEPGEGGETAAA